MGDNGLTSNLNDWTVPWGKFMRIEPTLGGYNVPSGNPYNDSIDPITKLMVGYGLSHPWRAVYYQNNFYIGDAVEGTKDVGTKQKVWRVASGYIDNNGNIIDTLGETKFDGNEIFQYDTPFQGRVILGAFNEGEVTPDTDQLLFADLSSRDLYIWTVDGGVSKVPNFTLPANILTFTRGANGQIYAGTANGNLYTMNQVL